MLGYGRVGLDISRIERNGVPVRVPERLPAGGPARLHNGIGGGVGHRPLPSLVALSSLHSIGTDPLEALVALRTLDAVRPDALPSLVTLGALRAIGAEALESLVALRAYFGAGITLETLVALTTLLTFQTLPPLVSL